MAEKKKPRLVQAAEVTRMIFGIPFMLLFGFKLGHLGHINQSLGDLFFNTHPWLYAWLGVLCTVSIVLEARQLWQMKKELDAIKRGQSLGLTEDSLTLNEGEIIIKTKQYASLKQHFIYNTLLMAIGSAFFVAFLHLGAPTVGSVAVLQTAAKIILLFAFSFDFIQKADGLISGDTLQPSENGSKDPKRIAARECISFLNKGLSVATLVILLFYPTTVSAAIITALACTCTALALIEAVIVPRFIDKKEDLLNNVFDTYSLGVTDSRNSTPQRAGAFLCFWPRKPVEPMPALGGGADRDGNGHNIFSDGN